MPVTCPRQQPHMLPAWDAGSHTVAVRKTNSTQNPQHQSNKRPTAIRQQSCCRHSGTPHQALHGRRCHAHACPGVPPSASASAMQACKHLRVHAPQKTIRQQGAAVICRQLSAPTERVHAVPPDAADHMPSPVTSQAGASTTPTPEPQKTCMSSQSCCSNPTQMLTRAPWLIARHKKTNQAVGRLPSQGFGTLTQGGAHIRCTACQVVPTSWVSLEVQQVHKQNKCHRAVRLGARRCLSQATLQTKHAQQHQHLPITLMLLPIRKAVTKPTELGWVLYIQGGAARYW
jgi:hypothetical protein